MRLPLLILHIVGGSIGLLSGTLAMAVRKGGWLHRASGNIFTIAMLTLAISGFSLAVMKSQQGNIIGSIGTFYLIGTAWLAGRRKEGTSLVDWGALLFGLAGAAASIMIGIHALRNPAEPNGGAPPAMDFVFATVLLLASAGDIRMLARGGISGRPRILRHLWRMCYGLFIATGSFFLGQQQVFPAFLRGSILLAIPALLPLPLLIYWFIRVRFGKAYKTLAKAESQLAIP
jgi:hypothetical protein